MSEEYEGMRILKEEIASADRKMWETIVKVAESTHAVYEGRG